MSWFFDFRGRVEFSFSCRVWFTAFSVLDLGSVQVFEKIVSTFEIETLEAKQFLEKTTIFYY